MACIRGSAVRKLTHILICIKGEHHFSFSKANHFHLMRFMVSVFLYMNLFGILFVYREENANLLFAISSIHCCWIGLTDVEMGWHGIVEKDIWYLLTKQTHCDGFGLVCCQTDCLKLPHSLKHAPQSNWCNYTHTQKHNASDRNGIVLHLSINEPKRISKSSKCAPS